MKKTTTLLMALVLGIGVVLADGADEKNAAEMRVKILPGPTSQVYKLMYLSDEKGLVKVSFYNEKGKKIFSDKVYNKYGFVRPYSFEELPEGSYTIELIDSKGVITREVAYVAADLIDLEVDMQAMGDQKYNLKVVGAKMVPIYVRIFDAAEELVTTDFINKSASFTKTYNLSKLPAGPYKFEVVQNGHVIATNKF